MKDIFKKIPKIRDKHALRELQRAHLMIVLLAVSLGALLVATTSEGMEWLVVSACTLLAFVAVFSGAIALSIYRR